MPIRKIIEAPNAILSTPSEMVDDPLSAPIKQLIADMKETVRAFNGLGLAAPQVGAALRIIVINQGKLPYAIINPAIKWSSQGTSVLEEGCLSVPNYFVKILRPKKVIVEGLDEQGKPVAIHAKDLLAKVFQHETDHTNGILISDRSESGILL